MGLLKSSVVKVLQDGEEIELIGSYGYTSYSRLNRHGYRIERTMIGNQEITADSLTYQEALTYGSSIIIDYYVAHTTDTYVLSFEDEVGNSLRIDYKTIEPNQVITIDEGAIGGYSIKDVYYFNNELDETDEFGNTNKYRKDITLPATLGYMDLADKAYSLERGSAAPSTTKGIVFVLKKKTADETPNRPVDQPLAFTINYYVDGQLSSTDTAMVEPSVSATITAPAKDGYTVDLASQTITYDQAKAGGSLTFNYTKTVIPTPTPEPTPNTPNEPITPVDPKTADEGEKTGEQPSPTTPTTPDVQTTPEEPETPASTLQDDDAPVVSTVPVETNTVVNQAVKGKVTPKQVQAAYNTIVTKTETNKVVAAKPVTPYQAPDGLPKTGEKENASIAVFGLVLASLGLVRLKKREN